MSIFKALLISLLLCFGGFLYSQPQYGYVKENTKMLDSTQINAVTILKGECFYASDLHLSNGAYKVRLLKNGQTGYLKPSEVIIERVLAEGTSFEELRVKEKDPVLKVHNNSRIPMSLKFAKKDYTLYPGNRISVRVPKGKHYYYISSSKSEYHYGKEVMDDYHIYDWEFFVDDVK